MLTRVYIDNYRCFVNFEYQPESRQLLFGDNGSGKSALLSAIRDIRDFATAGKNPFTQSTRTRWQDKPVQVLELEALLDNQTYHYRIEVGFELDQKQQTVGLERLTVSGATVFELAQGEIRLFPDGSDRANAIRFKSEKSALHLSQLSNHHVRRFVEWVETVRCFHIDSYPDMMEETSEKEEREPDDEMNNIAGWYRRMVQADPVQNISFLRSMGEVLDGFGTLRFAVDEDKRLRLRADFAGPTNGQVSFALSELSDGQRYLIALYMILHFLLMKGRTVFIDEPDNFVTLREIQPWLLSAEESTEEHGAQLILVSHHPEILNQWAPSHGLRFSRERNGQVRIEKFGTDPEMELTPSELMARGWVGE